MSQNPQSWRSGFNTAMSGYQEALTDPSYAEQILVMTYPHIGNTGVNPEDVESIAYGYMDLSLNVFRTPHRTIVRLNPLEDYLIANEIPLHGIDTRSLVRHLRDKGAMKGVICTDGTDMADLTRKDE